MLNGLVSLLLQAVQGTLDGFAYLANVLIAAWPFEMPELPEVPDLMLEIFGWMRWGPLGIVYDGCFALFGFLVSVWLAYTLAQPLMRWLKVWD